MARGYSPRKTENREAYRIFVIVCEGEKTERIYFNHYKERKSGLQIITPNSRITDPKNLVQFALNQISKYDLNLDAGDQVWCVFDADKNTGENLKKAIKIAEDKVNLCLSNPCFELWYLLHFCYFNNRISTRDLQSKLEEYIQNYDKATDYFDLLLSKRDTAIKHAKKLKQMHEKAGKDSLNLESNPSTLVFELVESILEVIQKNKN